MNASYEGTRTAAGPEGPVAAPETVFYDDGSLNEQHLADTFGLGQEEANQVVTFGEHTGTVAQMLADPGCPVGGIVKAAYKKDGLDGVVQKLGALGQMDEMFSVKISERSIERDHAKKKIILQGLMNVFM